MANQIFYKIPFKSFRNGTDYVVNVWKNGTLPAGYPLTLKGAAEPFTTQEDDTDDMFAPVRTQTGYIRIVDDGRATLSNGQQTAFNWRDLLPVNDIDTMVQLADGSGAVVWQGFLQQETFGNELYGYVQELELPVLCCLSVLEAKEMDSIDGELHNFAYLLKYLIDAIPQRVTGEAMINQVVVQGGADARQWLRKKADWQNFMNETNEGYSSKYTLLSILEDVCRYWGWTARTMGQTLYLTCMDDGNEQSLLTLSYAQLASLADESSASAGSIAAPETVNLDNAGSIFTSTSNEDVQMRGPSKATVKADCNEQDTVVKFAPYLVRKVLENDTTWEWDHAQGDDNLVGFFYTSPMKSSFNTPVMSGSTASGRGAFGRRKVYSSADADKATDADIMLLAANAGSTSTPAISIETNRSRMYGGGSLSITASLYKGAKLFEPNPEMKYFVLMRVGIGETRASAKWFYLGGTSETLLSGWSTTPSNVMFITEGSEIKGPGIATFLLGSYVSSQFPVEDGLHGKIFVDIMGWGDTINGFRTDSIAIANMEIKYTRDVTVLPTAGSQPRARTMQEDRNSEREYTAKNGNNAHDEWNADCIFASDNNMEYGYGLLVEPDGSYMSTAPYNGNSEHPEQHLADRVAYYWRRARRRVYGEVTSQSAAGVTPAKKVTMAGTTMTAVAISHNWRDDITQLTMMEV